MTQLKTQNANVSFRSRLPSEIQSRLEGAAHPVSEGESDEEEFMDAEDMIVVAGAETGEEMVDEVREIIPEDVSMDDAGSIH